MTAEPRTLTLIRRALLVVLWVGLVGMEVELLLLKHTEGRWQLLPLVLIGLTLVVLVWYAIGGAGASLRLLNVLMVLFLVTGVVGSWLHFDGNIVYERESDPSLSGMKLYQIAVMGATPTLAPGVMIQLALLGFAFTFRHPALTRPAHDSNTFSREDIS